MHKRFFIPLMVAFLCATSLAQVPVRGGGPGPRRNRPEPCWQVAGVSRSAMQQARSIRQQARQEVEAVCANSSLPPQQKRQQIQEIRQKERQQLESVISPAQEQSMQACRKERGLGGHVGRGGHGTGPCGEMPGGKKAEKEAEPED